MTKTAKVNEKEPEKRYCRNATVTLFKTEQTYSRITANKAEEYVFPERDMFQVWNYIHYCINFSTFVTCTS